MAGNTETATRPELIFGLVGPVGTRLADLATQLKRRLEAFGYTPVDIRLSDLLAHFSEWSPLREPGDYDRIRHLQEMGNALRRRLNDGAALARAGIAAVRAARSHTSGSPDRPASAHAYILHQLKHPDEVELLRRVYGPSFLLVAGHAPKAQRADRLAEQMARIDLRPTEAARYQGKAFELIEIDEKQGDKFGQNTRDTYPQADFFANLGVSGEYEVSRFVDLVFGHPYHTPLREEYAMYQAGSASLRSSDDNRQVGAAIVTLTADGSGVTHADVIAVGMNEVPRGGGGYYWSPDSPDHRDQRLLQQSTDRAREMKVGALAELIDRIRGKRWLQAELESERSSDLARKLLPDIEGTQFMNIGEFSRPVHAEMAALIDAARRGVSVDGHAMYVTTFPCHNCAKHIIAAGIRKVVYLEPYPKSRAGVLHGEEITESADGKLREGKVVYCAFTGVAPRQYRQLFSMSERGAKKGMRLNDWEANRKAGRPPYVGCFPAASYTAAELHELGRLPAQVFHWEGVMERSLNPGPPPAPGRPETPPPP